MDKINNFAILFGIVLTAGCHSLGTKSSSVSEKEPEESRGLITDERQLIFTGKRSGEGYFHPSGSEIVFQSEARKDNPFYQIFTKNLKTGETEAVSSGVGKTTCAWFDPKSDRILYSSTHHDPSSKAQQEKELSEREAGRVKRYSWDYDPEFDLYFFDRKSRKSTRLTQQRGYTAEGSISPDGKWALFSSNHHAYEEEKSLSPEDVLRLKERPDSFLELYVMNLKTKVQTRLTFNDSYDGGPFFSAQGDKITWRRFAKDGHSAEIFVNDFREEKTSSSTERQLTQDKKMNWAPYFHPSGDYIIFTSNALGYQNFELFVVDTEGKSKPLRATFKEGFDGLPVFDPSGEQLLWTSTTGSGQSQLHMASWNDGLARRLLNLPVREPALSSYNPSISKQDIQRTVDFLSSKELEGRDTGSPSEERYQKWLSDLMKTHLRLKPWGSRYQHTFSFPKAAKISERSRLKVGDSEISSADWSPALMSRSGEFLISNVVDAGHGLEYPDGTLSHPQKGEIKIEGSSDFKDTDVKGKWVLIRPDYPDDLEPELRVYAARYSPVERRVSNIQSRGGAGVLILRTDSKDQRWTGSALSSEERKIPVIVVSKDALASIQKTPAQVKIEIERSFAKASNVVGWLPSPGANRYLVIGAHGDHLGKGFKPSSRSAANRKEPIHFGADDNASGVALVLELAHFLSAQSAGLPYHVVFAIWSGEEMGNLGSKAFLKDNPVLSGSTVAYMNFDMVGRLQDKLTVGGTGSASEWSEILDSAFSKYAYSQKPSWALRLDSNPHLPTDALSFYLEGIPVVSFFTGTHEDYHTDLDTPDKINAAGIEQISELALLVISNLSKRKGLSYQKVSSQSSMGGARSFGVFLGTIPEYAKGPNPAPGVELAGTIPGGPAEKAGLQKGDRIIRLGALPIDSIQDYVFALQSLKPNVEVELLVVRGGNKEVKLTITPLPSRK